MRKSINLLFLSLLLLTSCGLFKNTTKTESKNEVKTEVKLDSSASLSTETVDKTKTTIVEKAQGTVYTKPIDVDTKSDLTSLLAGIKLVKDSGLVRITQSYDTLLHVISTQVYVKPQPVEYYADKTTVIENDINAKVDAAASLKRDSSTSALIQNKKTKSTPSILIWVVTGLLLLALSVGIIYYKRKKGL